MTEYTQLVAFSEVDETNWAPLSVFVSVTDELVPDPSCFNKGTLILCYDPETQTEEYRPVETLKRGDLVKTYLHGYRPVDLVGSNVLINDPLRFDRCMYAMRKAKHPSLVEDLLLTGGHGVLVDSLGKHKRRNDRLFQGQTPMLDGKWIMLVAASPDFEQIRETQVFTYYHFTVSAREEGDADREDGEDDMHVRYGVWANGVLCETPSKAQYLEFERAGGPTMPKTR